MPESLTHSGVDALHDALPTFLQHCNREKYRARSTLIEAGEHANKLFYLLKGSVSVSTERDGREFVLAYLREGDFFGEIGLFDERRQRSAKVRARTRCEVATMDYDRLRLALDASPEILNEIVTQMALRLRDTDRKVQDLAFVDVRGRVASMLLELSKSPEAVQDRGGARVRITRKELARLTGCSREVAGRVLKHLEEARLVEVNGRNILVHGNSPSTN